MKSVILDAAGDGDHERSVRRWRIFHDWHPLTDAACGVLLLGPPAWALHVYLGKWLIGIERACEEDD